jgi:hypothetical protein
MLNDMYRVVRVSLPAVESETSSVKFNVEDRVAEFDRRADLGLYDRLYGPHGEVMDDTWQELGDHHNLGDKDRGWKEQILNLRNPEALENEEGALNLECDWVTSYDVRALRGPDTPFFQLAAIGAVVTKDDQILLGTRGGAITPERVKKFGSGLYGLPPGGSVSFRPEYIGDPNVDPIQDTIGAEFAEEIGPQFRFEYNGLIGIFEAFEPGPTGIKFLSLMRTTATLHEIQEVNKEANAVYDELVSTVGKEDAKKELIIRKLPPDAWEHSEIFGIPLSLASAGDRSLSRALSYSSNKYTGIGAGALCTLEKFLQI